MVLDTGVVHHALRQLEQKGLGRQVFSTRAERYEHRAGARFSLPLQQMVLLGLWRKSALRHGSPAHDRYFNDRFSRWVG